MDGDDVIAAPHRADAQRPIRVVFGVGLRRQPAHQLRAAAITVLCQKSRMRTG